MEMEAVAQENGERIEEGSEDTDDADSMSDTASVGDTDTSDTTSPASIRKALDEPSSSGLPQPSPLHTRSHGKAKKTKDREPFYKGYGVVYLPGDINGLTKKVHLLSAEFFAGNTTVRNELVHELDALLRLKQLTRKECTDITARLAASL